jgi:hypothetical protein
LAQKETPGVQRATAHPVFFNEIQVVVFLYNVL